MSGTTPIISVAVAVIVPVVGVVLLVLWARGIAAKARAGIEQIGAGRTPALKTGANSFGIRSRGAVQWRGFGYLALFDDELVFVQAGAGNHVRAKLTEITGMSTPRSWLGKTQVTKLLAFEWRTGEGTDQIALRVPDLPQWLDALGKAGVEHKDELA
jgi:hypothetical protein